MMACHQVSAAADGPSRPINDIFNLGPTSGLRKGDG
jgi:hypothetical protein